MVRLCSFWLFGVLVSGRFILFLPTGATGSSTFDLTGEGHPGGSPCSALATDRWRRVDLICRLPDSSICPSDAAIISRWTYISSQKRAEVLTGSDIRGKYVIFTTSNPTVTLLRIHRLRYNSDPGLYTCEFMCEEGGTPVHSASVDLCVEHGAAGLVLCGATADNIGCFERSGDGVCDTMCRGDNSLRDLGDCLTTVMPVALPAASGCEGVCAGVIGYTVCDSRQCVNKPTVTTPPVNQESVAVVIEDVGGADVVARAVSLVLKTPVRVAHTSAWSVSDGDRLMLTFFNTSRFYGKTSKIAHAVYLTLETELCVDPSVCWSNAAFAAKYLARVMVGQEDSPLRSSSRLVGIAYTKTPYHQCAANYTGSLSPWVTLPPVEPTYSADSVRDIAVGAGLGGFAFLLLVVGLLVMYALHRRQTREAKSSSGDPLARHLAESTTSDRKYDTIDSSFMNSVTPDARERITSQRAKSGKKSRNNSSSDTSFHEVRNEAHTAKLRSGSTSNEPSDSTKFASIRKGRVRSRRSVNGDVFSSPARNPPENQNGYIPAYRAGSQRSRHRRFGSMGDGEDNDYYSSKIDDPLGGGSALQMSHTSIQTMSYSSHAGSNGAYVGPIVPGSTHGARSSTVPSVSELSNSYRKPDAAGHFHQTTEGDGNTAAFGSEKSSGSSRGEVADKPPEFGGGSTFYSRLNRSHSNSVTSNSDQANSIVGPPHTHGKTTMYGEVTSKSDRNTSVESNVSSPARKINGGLNHVPERKNPDFIPLYALPIKGKGRSAVNGCVSPTHLLLQQSSSEEGTNPRIDLTTC